MFPMKTETFGEFSPWIFQQDGASINRSEYTASWLRDLGVACLKWPAKFPDSNFVENVWSLMVRLAYSHGKQFSSSGELKQEIPEVWQGLDASYVRGIYHSTHRRLLAAIDSSGGVTKY